ncbi:MAG: hypothetical protein QM790_18775 [Nibricoccus sp.]
MSERDQKPHVTVEDLLHFKRSERPSPDFWPRFEQQLRAKQLAALVIENRPWWRRLSSRKTFVRLYAPVSIAAVVAFSFVSWRSSSAPVVTSESAKVASEMIRADVAAEPQVIANVEISAPPSALATEVQDTLGLSEPATHVAAVSMESSSPESAERFLASGAATFKAAGQALAQLVGLDVDSAEKVDAAGGVLIEPLMQVATPRDSRRSRLLAYSVAYDPHAAGSSDAVRSRERITRRISDEAIYDSISRLGVSGDRVSIKF